MIFRTVRVVHGGGGMYYRHICLGGAEGGGLGGAV